ncbi:MAG: RNA methyltransferase [Acidobacteria bacterium]|nr:RNA methyltransferase [Acidobacteriota bacterium]
MKRRALVQVIEGRHHPLLKKVRQMARSGELLCEGEVLLETPKLVEEALASGARISRALVSQPAPQRVKELVSRLSPPAKMYEVSPKLMESVSGTESQQGVLALASAPQWSIEDLFRKSPALLVVLAGVQDPGNLGTVLRAAEAFGATGVLLLRGTVSLYNAKVVRATAGALFRMPTLSGLTEAEAVQLLRENRVPLHCCVAREGKQLEESDLSRPVALAFGSEGRGLPQELMTAGQAVSIPMAGAAESLNVAVAAAVALYEAARQRKLLAKAR